MRDYSKVSGQFWTGKTGRALRGDMQAQIVALYLMTNSHANMIGVFHCPVIYLAHETGSPLEGAKEGLRRLIEMGFCTYDEDSETVWVHEMAKFQIGDGLEVADKRVKGVQKQFEALQEGHIKQGFCEKYRASFHLSVTGKNKSPSEAPSESLPSQKQEQEQEQEQKDTPRRVQRVAFVKPSLDEVTAYCKDRKNAVNPQAWINYYEANGWRVGKNPMKDWRAAVRTWETNAASRSGDNRSRTDNAPQPVTRDFPR